MPIGPYIFRTKLSRRRVQREPTSKFSSTTRGVRLSATRTAIHFRPGTIRSLPSKHGKNAAPDARATTPRSHTGACVGGAAFNGRAMTSMPTGPSVLYTDGQFFAAPAYCESYGKNLVTGAPVDAQEYRARNPHGKAMIKAAQYVPPREQVDDEYPYALITGRTLYHFHTRTKTARVPQLQAAAPQVWVEVSAGDALRNRIDEGDLVAVMSRRGIIEGQARITGIREGVIFVPFHYGYWDTPRSESGRHVHRRAANEMTVTDWDPASKQPIFKTAACRIQRLGPPL